MDGIEPDQYGVIGIIGLLIGKMIIEYWKTIGQEKPTEVRNKVYERLEQLDKKIDKIHSSIKILYEWHDKEDGSGNKLWYRGQTDATLDRLETRLKEILSNLVQLERRGNIDV